MKLIKHLWVKRPKIGLALSGGATHGASHVGVLQVLEQYGIRPDIVTGTSAGALVGAAYCAGIPLDEIGKLFQNMDWPTLLKISVRRPLSIFDTQPMENFLKQKLGDIEFKDLKTPFNAIACDINTGERVVLKSGSVATAVRASAAIPGLFSPVTIGEHLLVDGGIVDNLPVEQARAMGAKYIIASDVSKRGKSNKKPDNPFEIVLAMIYIMQARGAIADKDESDCYIRPDVSQYSSWGFNNICEMIEEGKIATLTQVKKIKRDLRIYK